MLKNYLTTVFRNLTKNKVYSFVNIGGLAIGMAVAIASHTGIEPNRHGGFRHIQRGCVSYNAANGVSQRKSGLDKSSSLITIRIIYP